MSTITLRQQAYQCIQGGILSGRMRAGSLVSELSLAKEIGIGRTPVREAIQQLQFEGLLEQVPRRPGCP
jgi:DNA-binding GntR family transcriptional regulator